MKAEQTADRSAKSTALKSNRASDAKKRYAFLLGQTDIFGRKPIWTAVFNCIYFLAHFINVAKMKAVDKSQFADFTAGDQASASKE